MKIFDMLRELHVSIDKHEKDYSEGYPDGYRDCLADMENKIKDSIEVEVK